METKNSELFTCRLPRITFIVLKIIIPFLTHCEIYATLRDSQSNWIRIACWCNNKYQVLLTNLRINVTNPRHVVTWIVNTICSTTLCAVYAIKSLIANLKRTIKLMYVICLRSPTWVIYQIYVETLRQNYSNKAE